MNDSENHLGDERFLSRVVIGRAWVLLFILGAIVVFDIGSSKSPVTNFTPVYLLLLLCFIQVAVGLFFSRGNLPGPISNSFQLFFDTVVVTLIVYITGSALSPFNFLYLTISMLAALSYPLKWSMMLSLLNGSVYLTLSWLTCSGVLPLIDGRLQTIQPSGGIWLQGVGITSGMLLVSYLTNILRGSILLGTELVERSKRDLEDLDNHHRSVFDSIPQPTLILDSQGAIVRMNLSARQLLLVGDDYLGEPAAELLKSYIPNIRNYLAGQDSEFQVNIDRGGQVKQFKVQLSKLEERDEKNQRCLVFYDHTDLASAQEKLAAHARMARLLARNTGEANQAFWNDGLEIVGESKLVRHVFSLISRVAETEATVLISGESGTGKELVARAIHRRSNRDAGPFVPVNCGAIPENLIESQFFGHTKGAFTGADRNYDGFFKQAHQGTLFLDEIGELPLNMQSKLLRVLQERRVRPLGSEKEFSVDVRIISATHKNLREEIKSGSFREDLYYRLNVISIPIPPLRKRKEDIPILIEYFIRKYCNDEHEFPLIHPETLELLQNYDYPGNIRELQNIIERSVILGGKALLPEHLPDNVSNPTVTSSTNREVEDRDVGTIVVEVDKIDIPCNLDTILATIERTYLEQALSLSGGVKKEAAKLLGINSRSLRYRLQKYKLEDS